VGPGGRGRARPGRLVRHEAVTTRGPLRLEIFPDADAVALHAARLVAAAARDAVTARGGFTLAVSGGRTPWALLRALATEDVPWAAVSLFQVDERVAPEGDPDRTWTHVRASLLDRVPLPAAQAHPMDVCDPDLTAAAARYAATLAATAGSPPALDLVLLGLGDDGHTASLVPGDPVLDVRDADVAATGSYREHRRLTLTFPALDRARRVLWIVTGPEKAPMLRRLLDADATIPAGRVRPDRACVLADAAAARDVTR